MTNAIAGMARLTKAFTALAEASRQVPWVRARILLGDDREHFTSARVTAVMTLADRLRPPPEAASDAELFNWLAGQVGLDHQDSLLRPGSAVPAPLRMFRLLDLAVEILGASEASLGAVRDLRRLGDLLPAGQGLAGDQTSQQIMASLLGSFGELVPAGVSQGREIRALVELAGQAKDARLLDRSLTSLEHLRGNLRRRIDRGDLQRVRDSAERVEQANGYLTGGPDLTADEIERLINELLNGAHTNDALRSAIALFRASGPAELTRLLRIGRLPALIGLIGPGDRRRGELTGLLAERFGAWLVARGHRQAAAGAYGEPEALPPGPDQPGARPAGLAARADAARARRPACPRPRRARRGRPGAQRRSARRGDGTGRSAAT